MSISQFCPCGERVASPARNGGLALRKSIYDPVSGDTIVNCTKCHAEVAIRRPTTGQRLVLGNG